MRILNFFSKSCLRLDTEKRYQSTNVVEIVQPAQCCEADFARILQKKSQNHRFAHNWLFFEESGKKLNTEFRALRMRRRKTAAAHSRPGRKEKPQKNSLRSGGNQGPNFWGSLEVLPVYFPSYCATRPFPGLLACSSFQLQRQDRYCPDACRSAYCSNLNALAALELSECL